jgi:two-component system CheB/CheR fusion protein
MVARERRCYFAEKEASMAKDESPSAPNNPRTTVVGIGASAGGVRALSQLFDALPDQLGAAFVVVVHLSPESRSELPNILSHRTKLGVVQVTETLPLRPDCIYVIPPDLQLKISDNEIAAIPFDEPRGKRAPIDSFFRSLASQHGDGLAVILSGGGSDGAIGVRAVKEAGGIILVQSPDEAEHDSMPRNAIATEVADFVLPIRQLAEQLAILVPAKGQIPAITKAPDEEEHLRRVLAHLRVRTGHDFSHYKRSTILRRVQRRMQITRKEGLDDYFAFLRDSADEAQALLADLLISVTTFFRDSRAFETLARVAITEMFKGKEHGSIRVWSAGCATGEEAYSVAMLLMEEASRHELRPEIQVFGSDMDPRALTIAREGRYPSSIEADVSEERLRRFFVRDGDYYRVKRDLRDVVLFANHSLLKDPPFSRLDLILCRNLLIYLDRDLQQQVLSTLHYGLNPDGYLFLGSSESAEHPDGLFRTIDRDARIYQSLGHIADRLPTFPRLSGLSVEHASLVAATPTPLSARTTLTAHRESLEATAPPSILVDDTHRVIHLSENSGRYLHPSAGPLTTDLTDLVRSELRFELRAALHRAFERHEQTLTAGIPVRFNGSAIRIHLQVKPMKDENNEGPPRRAIVFFIEGDTEDSYGPSSQNGIAEPNNQAVERLKQELELSQARLRTTREESEAANEELRAANEELQSINEEYRSTAEELETSKEELQSINEELQTVNSELKLKLETVSRANSDLQNLMAAMDFGTLFLDPTLKIKRFTPRLSDLFSITPGDIGRPITDFTHQLDYDELTADAKAVLDNLVPIEREIRSRKGEWYLVRYRPYRTVDDKIDGVVATFVDVTERRQMENALRTSEERLRQEMRLVELSRAPIFVWDYDGGILQWNRGSEELYGFTREEAIGKRKELLLKSTVPGSSFATVKGRLLADGTWKGELHQETKLGHPLIVESQIELVKSNGRRLVLESTRDITESKLWEGRQRLLLRELTHRVKNTLAVVQSIIHQTARSSSSLDDLIERLDGRIAALANAHKLLVDSDWTGADLRRLAESQIAAYVPAESGRLEIQGAAVQLPPEVATPFGLVLHELATNAAKYGALSVDRGKISLRWALASRNDTRTLTVVWQEQDGPAPHQAPEPGFGSRLIDSGVPGSEVKREYLATGLRCTIRMQWRDTESPER